MLLGVFLFQWWRWGSGINRKASAFSKRGVWFFKTEWLFFEKLVQYILNIYLFFAPAPPRPIPPSYPTPLLFSLVLNLSMKSHFYCSRTLDCGACSGAWLTAGLTASGKTESSSPRCYQMPIAFQPGQDLVPIKRAFFFFWHSFPMKTSSQAFVCSLCFYTLWTQHCQEEAILVMHEIRLDLCLTVESNPLNWSCYLLLWTEGLDTPCLSPVLTLEWQLQHRLFVSLGCLNPSF